ncbi:DUF4270 family protein [Pontibacter silvestris]|uniref:DUF4270 family protein n=1 Tax=Pontibacter silvestris TaxID=2305183 RepID=A0ABW4WWK3_9BACT|nr:DUF4270 family protein [Pontibacter silvestris]MCC9136670.1 DUF4270 domain-containing protein [Pontibacter silvestris]
MNLAVRRFLLFFFSVAVLTACDDPNEVGLELQDENQIGTDYTDTLTINTGTVLLNDSIRSFKVSPALVGQYADPVLGTVKATTFTEMGLSSTNVSLGDNPVADSLVLALDYTMIYGDKSSELTVNVHQLTERFQERASYFTNSQLAYEETPLGSKTFTPQILNSGTETAPVDSAVAVNIRLDQQLAEALVAQSGQGPLQTQSNFNEFFKGLALVSPEGSNIVGLNLLSSRTKMTLYYKNGETQKTQSFIITSAENYFTGVTGDRSGTAVAELTEKGEYLPAAQTGGESYIQANTQLLTKLTFPYLDQFKQATDNIIINRAEVIIPVKSSSTSSLAPPPQLAAYQTNSSNRALTPLQQDRAFALNTTSFPAAVSYNAEKEQYSINITSYFQAMLLGNRPNNGLLLAPAKVVITSQQTGATAIQDDTSPYRAVINNTDSDKVKLLIYYSKLN